MKKFVIPEIATEDMTPEIAEQLASTEKLLAETIVLYEENLALKKELLRLKVARKYPLRQPK